jgi:capsular polysaccharide biosynthesis protein
MYTPNINIVQFDELESDLVNNKNIYNIENIFLFYSFHFQISLCHYLSQCIPKLVDYKNLNNPRILLGIPKHTYNELTIDILNYYKISKDLIFLLEDNIVYNIKNLYHKNHYESWDICDNKLKIYNTIRNNLEINDTIPIKRIYLKRDGISNKNTGNGEVGITRKISNEDLLINKLKELNFEIITLGNKNLVEKKNLLNNCDILITQLGANLFNLAFSNLPKKIIILSNNYLVGIDFYLNFLSKLNNKQINYKLFQYDCDNLFIDPKNNTNNSFKVNINEIINSI